MISYRMQLQLPHNGTLHVTFSWKSAVQLITAMAGKNRFLGSVFWGFKKTKIFKIQKFSFLGGF